MKLVIINNNVIKLLFFLLNNLCITFNLHHLNLLYYLISYHNRRGQIAKTIREITKIVQDVLKEVEVQEPRFISSLNECNGHYEGMFTSLNSF